MANWPEVTPVDKELEFDLVEFFSRSPEFQDFGAQVKPIVTAPPQPQIFHTDLSPIAAFSSPLTEVYRIKIESGGNDFEVVRKAWWDFTAAVESSLHVVLSLSGMAVVGWEGGWRKSFKYRNI